MKTSTEQNNQCITKCYKNNDIPDFGLPHPFMGIYLSGDEHISKCVNKYYTYDNFAHCDKNTIPQINIENSLNVPIHPTSYLHIYYNIKNISDVITYLQHNTKINKKNKARLIDFALLTFSESFDVDIDRWIEIIQLIFPEYEIFENMVVKIFKKIFKTQNIIDTEYPFDFLDTVGKYLEHNI